MAELTQKERLQPSLLDRLTDDEPGKREESREKRVLSMTKIRQSVLRDLSWLLNTANFEAVQDLAKYPQVKRSVLNYGMSDLAGKVVSNTDVLEMENTLKQAILSFEPRILRKTLRLRVTASDEPMDKNALVFEIQGDLWAQPLPEPLYLKTVIDLDMNQVNIDDMSR